MSQYLSYKFEDSPEFVSTFDEAPLWSASFGLLLLKHLSYRPNLTILDLGSGAGFPLMELASRFGASCFCYGLDPWTNANARANQKIKNYDLGNVQVIEGSAATIPLTDNSIDLITSNLGINNFDEPAVVFKECQRVLKTGGKLALTTNLNVHWAEFYMIFETVLAELDKPELLGQLKQQQEHRGTVETISKLFTDAGLTIYRHYEESFEMKFTDGSAFLNHYFIKLGWLGSWLTLIQEEDRPQVFGLLEQRLNEYAEQQDGLTLTVPTAFIEGVK